MGQSMDADQFRKKFAKRGRGRTSRRIPGTMNGTEQKYAARLDLLEKSGQILMWKYEGITLKLADMTRWTPDFFVQALDGSVEFHECKGRIKARKGVEGKADRKEGPRVEDHSWVKVKVAASMYPFRFVVVYPGDVGWIEKEIEL